MSNYKDISFYNKTHSYIPNNNEFNERIPFEAITEQCTPTLNKKLTGEANPRTLTRPTIPPPSHDITVWRQNPTITHSQINTKTPSNPYMAGFDVSRLMEGFDEPEQVDRITELTEKDISDPFMVPLQPNIYTSTDDFQPINANLGIAYPPQFPENTLISSLGNNAVFFDTNCKSSPEYIIREQPFELIHPEYKTPIIERRQISDSSGPDSVYDPRFVGYGSSDRGYQDKLLGSAKFYYDDINAIRMPSYITRNKIDSCVTPCGDKYGDLKAGYLSLSEAKKGAEHSWRENSLNYRVNLSKSLMRKKDEEMVQRRFAPKYTF